MQIELPVHGSQTNVDIHCFNLSIHISQTCSHLLAFSRIYTVNVFIVSSSTKNNGLDKRYHRAQCRLKLFLGAESDPDSTKHKGRNRREGGGGKGWGGRNINETGVKEKYWADVVVQMQNA